MKGLFVTSATNETFKYADSFDLLDGAEVRSLRYTNRSGREGTRFPGLMDEPIVQQAAEWRPDVIVYIGSRWGELVEIPNLLRLREIAPTVHICSDAADPPWWDLLEEYDRAQCFALQVAIDGNKNWPLEGKPGGLTSLTPFKPARFPDPPIPHVERTMQFGYGGNLGGSKPKKMRGYKPSNRWLAIEALRELGMAIRQRNDEPQSYQKYADFLSQCRVVANFPWTGTEVAMQVKGRVVEVGLAGAVLLERRGAPTADWFELGVDFLDWGSPAEAIEIVRRIAVNPEETQAMGLRFRERVIAEHGPARFWGRIFDRIGLPAPTEPAPAIVEATA